MLHHKSRRFDPYFKFKSECKVDPHQHIDVDSILISNYYKGYISTFKFEFINRELKIDGEITHKNLPDVIKILILGHKTLFIETFHEKRIATFDLVSKKPIVETILDHDITKPLNVSHTYTQSR